MPEKPGLVTSCKTDPHRLAVFRDCTETSGMDYVAPESEWPWNVLSKNAIAYSCGAIARPGVPIRHKHLPEEFDLCKRLSEEAALIMEGRDVGMGSESSDPFRPYFFVSSVDESCRERVTEEVIRTAFGSTIYPPTKIVIEPLEEHGSWWSQVFDDGGGRDGYLRPWREMIRWFHSRPELHSPVFVMIGDDPLDDKNGGCVFPRLAVAITARGSLVGIGGWVVHT